MRACARRTLTYITTVRPAPADFDLDQIACCGNWLRNFAGTLQTGCKLRHPPTIRPCPVCSIAMQASKSRDDLQHFDVFECQHCDTTIIEAASPPLPEQP
jgi:hypothetical protein